jgi:hypothetical protein
MTDITVTIWRDPKGWRWTLDYDGDVSEGRHACGSIIEAAQAADHLTNCCRMAAARRDPKAQAQRALADATHFGVDQFPPMPAAAVKEVCGPRLAK